MPARKLRLIHTPTPEWEEMRRFYRDLLGLEEVGGWDAPGDRGSFLGAGQAEIEVMEADAASLGILARPLPGWQLALQVEDAAAERERLASLGVPIEREVEPRPWGGRDFLIRDPAGNAVLLFEAPE